MGVSFPFLIHTQTPMVKNNWKEEDKEEYIKKYAAKYGEDIALRVYTSRLIGCDSNRTISRFYFLITSCITWRW